MLSLLTEIDKLPLMAADVAVLFGVLTRRGCSRRDVAKPWCLLNPPKRQYGRPFIRTG
jgi:hypothetical protein